MGFLFGIEQGVPQKVRVVQECFFSFCLREVRTFQIFAIYTGYYLIDLILMGAIVGAWKKKSELPARKFSEG